MSHTRGNTYKNAGDLGGQNRPSGALELYRNIYIYIYGVARCLMWVLETELEQQVLLTTKPRALVFIYVSVLSYPRIIVTGF